MFLFKLHAHSSHMASSKILVNPLILHCSQGSTYSICVGEPDYMACYINVLQVTKH